MSQPWNFLPCKPPRKDTPVLVVKGHGKRSFVREAVYQGDGYWAGFGNAPVRAWQSLPSTPISIALEKALKERDQIIDSLSFKQLRGSTLKHHKRILQIEAQIDRAQRKRETPFERFVHDACVVLKTVEKD